jgi:hypothetical protein
MLCFEIYSSGKGKRLIVLHAGNREEGLIDRCDLVFLAKAKDGESSIGFNSQWRTGVLRTT